MLQARGQGAPGTVEATVRVSLSPAPRDGGDDGDSDGGDSGGGDSGGGSGAGGNGSTRVDYDAEAVVGGMVGGVGQRMLAAVAKRTAAQFFAAVEDDLTGPEPRVEAGVERPLAGGPARGPGGRGAARVPAVPPSEGGRVVHEGRRDERRPASSPWPMAAAFVTGGAVALAGVALGHALARRARGPA
ncbi:hypothetical protein ACFQHO_37075 [Actinomadura yumaensis]|uniref:hypothetical protein n=1 Tax=Actinomadura yumaensis TaxID=111807 RepID=UPI00360EE898